jgi:hypothetical protein
MVKLSSKERESQIIFLIIASKKVRIEILFIQILIIIFVIRFTAI